MSPNLPNLPVPRTLTQRSFLARAMVALVGLWLCAAATGCSLFPDIKHKPQYNNPFPQVKTVAVLPFVNQSEDATLSADRVTLAYINELQSIPGFEVLPLGVVKAQLEQYRQPLACGEDFQAFARYLGVDAVLLGSVIDYSAYYPPRMSMKVNWYAANPGYHPVLPGYGLPWGTKEEKKIPRWIHQEAQRALAAEQMRTQTPELLAEQPLPTELPPETSETVPEPEPVVPAEEGDEELVQPISVSDELARESSLRNGVVITAVGESPAPASGSTPEPTLPPAWPDPRGFIPDPPLSAPPAMLAQHEPIISHMRNYNGHDEDFTQRVSDYFYFRDDARFGGWKAYLQRSEDFIRVCCHFHITETLAARGGQDESRLILRWPIDRYQR